MPAIPMKALLKSYLTNMASPMIGAKSIKFLRNILNRISFNNQRTRIIDPSPHGTSTRLIADKLVYSFIESYLYF